MQAKILIVDDDVQLTRMMDSVLRQYGFETVLAHSAEDGLSQAQQEQPDLALLDVMMPVIGGWELCRLLRAESDIPILFLTALGETEHIVHGLELGADDYLVKPFKKAELLARIRAHLRRAQASAGEEERFVFGDGTLIVDLAARRVTVDDEEVTLTPREYELLEVLVRNAGRVLTASDLIAAAWGEAYRDTPENVKPYIHYLRKKLEKNPALPRWIQTARGVGYRFVG
jgi:DNA-binding response OmpR family regulator